MVNHPKKIVRRLPSQVKKRVGFVIQNCIGDLAIGDVQHHLAIICKNGDELMNTGIWKDAGDGKVELDYNDGGTGELVLTFSTTFKVGSTAYNRY